MGNRVTLADVSKKAGLSQATVSMILSRRSDVSFPEKTVQAVQEAARELGYVPPARKRSSLFSHRTIMIVCPFVLNSWYSTIVQTVQSEAAAMHCTTIVSTTYHDPDVEKGIVKAMAESQIGGAIFAMMPRSLHVLKKIIKTLPLVIIADREENMPFSFAELHNYDAGQLMAKHLISLGHSHVACLATPLSNSIPARVKRFEGLRDTWAKLCPEGEVRLFSRMVGHVQERDTLMLERTLGRDLTLAVCESEAKRYTAFIGINDMIAYGILDAMQILGFRVPDDYSVCGLDNDFPSDLGGVNLTSVEHFMQHNARLAFRMLYRKMEDETDSTDPGENIRIFPELKVRGTSSRSRS